MSCRLRHIRRVRAPTPTSVNADGRRSCPALAENRQGSESTNVVMYAPRSWLLLSLDDADAAHWRPGSGSTPPAELLNRVACQAAGGDDDIKPPETARLPLPQTVHRRLVPRSGPSACEAAPKRKLGLSEFRELLQEVPCWLLESAVQAPDALEAVELT